MSAEPDFNAHMRCTHCHGVKARRDLIYVDDKPICSIGGCKDAYYASTRPVSVPKSVGYYDKG